jgi:hypothetical protein
MHRITYQQEMEQNDCKTIELPLCLETVQKKGLLEEILLEVQVN